MRRSLSPAVGMAQPGRFWTGVCPRRAREFVLELGLYHGLLTAVGSMALPWRLIGIYLLDTMGIKAGEVRLNERGT
jgi:hypothetical protein